PQRLHGDALIAVIAAEGGRICKGRSAHIEGHAVNKLGSHRITLNAGVESQTAHIGSPTSKAAECHDLILDGQMADAGTSGNKNYLAVAGFGGCPCGCEEYGAGVHG